MSMLRDISFNENGHIDCTDSRVGVLASEIPLGFALPPFLLNDINAEYPNRLYSMKILSLPIAGVLTLDKRGVGSFTGAPAGTYTGTQLVEKYDPSVGLVSSEPATYSITVAPGEVIPPPDEVPVVTEVIILPDGGTGSGKFTAQVIGTGNPSQDVTWTKLGPGSIDTDGYFTAPARTNIYQIISITATSVADPTKKDMVVVVVPALVIVEVPPEVLGVTVTPAGLFLLGGSSRQFAAVVSGTGNVSQEVTWSIDKGTINASGVAVMPEAVFGEQLVTVTATSVQNPLKSASVTVTVQSLGEIDPNSIVLSPARILRTSGENWKIREGYDNTDGDTFYLSQGLWTIDKDADDILYYALDIIPYLQTINAGISSVEGLVAGVTLLSGPFVRDQLIIVKIGGGDRSLNYDTVNSLTFRIICSNGEKFDRTIYFVMKDN